MKIINKEVVPKLIELIENKQRELHIKSEQFRDAINSIGDASHLIITEELNTIFETIVVFDKEIKADLEYCFFDNDSKEAKEQILDKYK